MTDNKHWLQIVCETSSEHSDTIETVMEEENALSITYQDAEDNPVLEPLPGETPLWKTLIITALFNADKDLRSLKSTLENNKQDWDIKSITLERVEDQDWERVWMKDFHPMKFGNNLWIYPSNYEIPDDSSIKIHLDPGLAFGTGTHPTTALCLEWLDYNPPNNLTVIDYGCGSGILAVAAAKLGAKHIIATDIDPQGLIATEENMQRNNISKETITYYLPENCPQEPVDLILANILCGPLLELYPVISSLTKPKGVLVISGLLAEQESQLIETYSAGFNNFKVSKMDDWIRISATRN